MHGGRSLGPKQLFPGRLQREPMSVSDGLSGSKGDPRLLFVLNAVLSASFVGIVLTLADLGDVVEFTWIRFAILTVLLMTVTYVLTR